MTPQSNENLVGRQKLLQSALIVSLPISPKTADRERSATSFAVAYSRTLACVRLRRRSATAKRSCPSLSAVPRLHPIQHALSDQSRHGFFAKGGAAKSMGTAEQKCSHLD